MYLRSLVAIGLLGACATDDEYAPRVCTEARAETVGPSTLIDVLLVVDATTSMADQAAELARFVDDLDFALDNNGIGTADVHLAVVTSDLGAGGVPGCDDTGDGADFQGAARCGLDGAYLRDVADGDARDRNFTADRGEVLACLIAAPATTCPVSQPLTAAVRALDGSVAGNLGFRRTGALLAVLVLTDGDDCSLTDPDALAVAAGNDVEGAVDFACFARGATCSPANLSAGVHRDCVPRADRGLADPVALAARLDDLGASWTVIGATAASADVAVLAGSRLGPVCSPSGGPVRGPAPRLSALGDGTARRAIVDGCVMPEQELVEGTIQPFKSDLGIPCLSANILLETCVGVWRDGDQILDPDVPACSDATSGALCYRLIDLDFGCPFGVGVDNTGVVPRGVVEVSCEVPCG